ncbi:DUF6292 family protein [Planosporangium sp. 12N6]|uniref:DUF6292 family protein n=1 Tax=Planosporangium spinosum TaxID=3402278 RepID=UPI003CE8332D
MTDHGPYIAAVATAVRAAEVPLVDTAATTEAGRRQARLRLDPQATVEAFGDAVHVELHWDEERGWRYVAHYEPHTGLANTPVYLGMGVLATPTEVANWIAAVLINPGMIASYGDDEIDPARTAGSADAQFEAELAAYGTPTTI